MSQGWGSFRSLQILAEGYGVAVQVLNAEFTHMP